MSPAEHDGLQAERVEVGRLVPNATASARGRSAARRLDDVGVIGVLHRRDAAEQGVPPGTAGPSQRADHPPAVDLRPQLVEVHARQRAGCRSAARSVRRCGWGCRRRECGRGSGSASTRETGVAVARLQLGAQRAARRSRGACPRARFAERGVARVAGVADHANASIITPLCMRTGRRPVGSPITACAKAEAAAPPLTRAWRAAHAALLVGRRDERDRAFQRRRSISRSTSSTTAKKPLCRVPRHRGGRRAAQREGSLDHRRVAGTVSVCAREDQAVRPVPAQGEQVELAGMAGHGALLGTQAEVVGPAGEQ